MTTTVTTRTLTVNQQKVLDVFEGYRYTALTDYKLGYAYRLVHGKLDQSWSGLRTRRSELRDLGLVEPTGKVLNEGGRYITQWALVI